MSRCMKLPILLTLPFKNPISDATDILSYATINFPSPFPYLVTPLNHFSPLFIFFSFPSRRPGTVQETLVISPPRYLPLFSATAFTKKEKTWVVERLKSRRSKTPQTGKSPTRREEMVFSRKPRNSLFFVMLRSLLSCSPTPTNSMSTLAPPRRTCTIYVSLKVFLFFSLISLSSLMQLYETLIMELYVLVLLL